MTGTRWQKDRREKREEIKWASIDLQGMKRMKKKSKRGHDRRELID